MSSNIALNKTVTTSSCVTPYVGLRVTDGSTAPTSRWICSQFPGWLMVDLGAQYYINRAVIRGMGSGGWPMGQYALGSFIISGSCNGGSFTPLLSVSGNTSDIYDNTFTAGVYRYVKLSVTTGLNINKKIASLMEFEVYNAPSPFLSALTVNNGTTSYPLTPAFNGEDIFAYSTTVTNDVTSVTVTPTAEETGETITVNGITVMSGAASQQIPLNFGNNLIKVVSSTSAGDKREYDVTVTRSGDSYLANVQLFDASNNVINYAPAFNGRQIFNYTASVGYNTASVTVLPTTDGSSETITVNGTVVASGSKSQPIPLNVGSNTITVVSTSTNNMDTIYTFTIMRAGNPNLSALVLYDGEYSMQLNPTFNGTVTSTYTSYAAFDSSKISVTPTAVDPSATITVNGTTVSSTSTTTVPFTGQTGIITVVSTAIGQLPLTFTINVIRSSDPYLSNLLVKSGHSTFTLSPAPGFDSRKNPPYTLNVANNISFVTFTPVAEANPSSIKLVFKGVTSNLTNNAASANQNLDPGDNAFEIDVVGSDNIALMKYNVTITRAAT